MAVESTRESRIPRLATLGKPALLYDGRDITIANRKALALIAYLADTTHGSESRERLAGRLWSESSEKNARASLRQTVGDIKDCLSVCENTPFSADRLNLQLRLSLIQTDV